MKILLVNVDSTIPNLALEKIRIYHQRKNDEVTMIHDVKATGLPMFTQKADKIYVSCIFDYNKHYCTKWEKLPNTKIGGSGYSLDIKLPDSIENIKPHMNFGFTTRGCIRNCYFCIVQRKEGGMKIVGDVYDLWDGKSKEVLIMDNNTLALPDHFFKIAEQIKKENLRVDFNQGLDFRLLTPEICKMLVSLKTIKGYHRFSFDDIKYKKGVLKALKMLKDNGNKKQRTRWYVYVGTKDTEETVIERLQIIKDAEQLPYLMLDHQVVKNEKFQWIKKWSNSPAQFVSIEYKDFENNNTRLARLRDEKRTHLI